MHKTLDILDNMEEIRQKTTEHPENYPIDYTIRLLTAIVAQAYGYNSRTEWTDQLKEIEDSRYYQRLNDGTFHV